MRAGRLTIAGLCGLLLLGVSCTNDLRDVAALPGNKKSPSQIGDSVTMLYTDSAQLKIMVKANRMLVFDKNTVEPLTILPKGVFVTFFDQDEKVATTLRADYGVRYDLTKRMEARYHVVVVNNKGETLETGIAPELVNQLRVIVSPDGEEGSLVIRQDARILAGRLTAGATAAHSVATERHAWVQVLSGTVSVNGEVLQAGDAASEEGPGTLQFDASADAELLVFDLS